MSKLRFLFGLSQRVIRVQYLTWGLLLVTLKYLGELVLYYLATEKILTPINFLSPLVLSRYPGFGTLPDWFTPAIVLWSLPFIWIGVGMSIRRAADANLSPWLGVLFFVPGLNYVLILGLSIVKSSERALWRLDDERDSKSLVMSPLLLSVVFALVGVLLAWFNTNFLKLYASSLFVGSPFILGLVQGYLLNYQRSWTFRKTVGVVAMTIMMIHLLLLFFALEGVICLAMSFPISFVLGVIGAIFGSGIASYGKPSRSPPVMMMLALPLMPVLESKITSPHQDVVLSTIEIEAPTTRVWPNVVSFSDLPPTDDWLFKLGVAHPLRARIEGQGVGAIRHCEFSTGAFVEPITIWDEPNRLAFDVMYQPQPMKELSFYDHIDAPHLDGYFRSIRGEFRLVPTADGKTRLEGRTWYQVDMQPGWYWQVYGRWFIHRIHLRVLAHIKHLSEKDQSI
jgi:hypothetical protein